MLHIIIAFFELLKYYMHEANRKHLFKNIFLLLYFLL